MLQQSQLDYNLMKLTKINLNNPIIKNYNSNKSNHKDNKHYLDKRDEEESRTDCMTNRYKSFNTIDISFNKPSFDKLISRSSQEIVRDKPKCQSNTKIEASLIPNQQQSPNKNMKIKNSKKSAKSHLHQILIEIQPQSTKIIESTKKVRHTKISSTIGIITPKQQIPKPAKRQQNQQIPSFIKIHLEKDLMLENRPTADNVQKQEFQMKVKKKTKTLLPPLPPLPNIKKIERQMQQDKNKKPADQKTNFQPYITQYKLIQNRNKSSEKKVRKNQRYLSQQKSKRRIYPKYSLQNIVLSADLCGWEPQ